MVAVRKDLGGFLFAFVFNCVDLWLKSKIGKEKVKFR